ncbi:MAG: DUF5058 family protein [Treponema sp.]|nr:DUF5058 family protein [Treponema sp.]
MDAELMAIVGSPVLWIIGGLLVLWLMVQSTLFIRLCFKEADRINYPRKKLTTAIKNGAVAAVGPALASVTVAVGMMAILGGPITWHRLSVIGAPQTDLIAANIGAVALGFDKLGGAGFTLDGVAIALLIMTINGCGWLIMVTLFTSKLDTLRIKLSGGDMTWLTLMSVAASIGLFANFSAREMMKGADMLVGVAAAFIVQFTLDKFVAPKFAWVKGYAITFALIAGVVSAALVGAAMRGGA